MLGLLFLDYLRFYCYSPCINAFLGDIGLDLIDELTAEVFCVVAYAIYY
jgi:hypothetical protein